MTLDPMKDTMAFTCDIILLSYESPDLLKKCVESILDRTRTPARLIIVDNASKDPKVARYLSEVSGRGAVEVTKVFNGKNLGFAGGMNVGLRLAEAPYVCLINNDCIVTDGWLEEMITLASSDKKIGLVCPESNNFGSGPSKDRSIEEYAVSLAPRKGEYIELGHAIFFACLIKKEVIDRIGLLDEAYAGVCYEDTDYSRRTFEAGYIAALAKGAYVYHRMQASRKKLKGKKEIYSRNRKLFEEKWGRIYRTLFAEECSSGTEGLRGLYEQLKGLARKRVFVEILAAPLDGPGSEDALCGLMRHSDIIVRPLKGKYFAFRALWKIFTKKKRYDAVFFEKGTLASLVCALRPLHGAEPFVRSESLVTHGPTGRSFDLADAGPLVDFIKKRKGARK